MNRHANQSPAASTVALWLPVGVVASAILLLTWMPGSLLPQATLIPYQDKLFHFLSFATLAFLVARALYASASRGSTYAAVVAGICTVIFALLDESIQRFVPNRTFEVYDLFANAAGAFCGIGVWLLIKKYGVPRDKDRPVSST